jgi:hypothetical protein
MLMKTENMAMKEMASAHGGAQRNQPGNVLKMKMANGINISNIIVIALSKMVIM